MNQWLRNLAKFWILEGHTLKEVPVWEWLKWSNARQSFLADVAETHVGKVRVHTDFIGLDLLPHAREPHLFETSAEGPDGRSVFGFYATWEEAEAGHLEAVRKVKEGGS